MLIMKFLKWIGLYNTGVPHTARQVASKAAARTHQAFRPVTQASYIRKFRLFVAYCCFIGIHLQNVIDIPLLTAIISICDTMWMGQIFKALYLTAFFSFLRVSNLVPHSIKAFSPIEQMSRGDVLFATPGIHLLIKWSKTIQTRDTIRILKIPSLGSSPLCPVQAIKNLLLITPGTENSPLFQVKNEAAQ